MSNPNQKYVSAGVQFGGVTVEIFRLADPTSNSSGASLGTYKVESLGAAPSAVVGKRPDIDGGQNGWWIVDGDIEGSAVIQRAAAATPSLENGDYFEAALRVSSAGTGVTERFVIHNPMETADAQYRKVSCSVIVDQSA